MSRYTDQTTKRLRLDDDDMSDVSATDTTADRNSGMVIFEGSVPDCLYIGPQGTKDWNNIKLTTIYLIVPDVGVFMIRNIKEITCSDVMYLLIQRLELPYNIRVNPVLSHKNKVLKEEMINRYRIYLKVVIGTFRYTYYILKSFQ